MGRWYCRLQPNHFFCMVLVTVLVHRPRSSTFPQHELSERSEPGSFLPRWFLCFVPCVVVDTSLHSLTYISTQVPISYILPGPFLQILLVLNTCLDAALGEVHVLHSRLFFTHSLPFMSLCVFQPHFCLVSRYC